MTYTPIDKLRDPDGAAVESAGTPVGEALAADLEVRDLLQEILAELRIINHHLACGTDEEITADDI